MLVWKHDSVAIIIIRVLQARGWSQKKLAEECGYDRFKINRWLAGRRAINTRELGVVLDTLELEIVPRGRGGFPEAQRFTGIADQPRAAAKRAPRPRKPKDARD